MSNHRYSPEFKDEAVRQIIESGRSVSDVHKDEIERILPLMAEWQGTGPFMTEVAVTRERFGSVPKTYVRASIDKMISPALQDAMIKNWEVDSVFELESGHFPTSSVPAELADTLLRAAAINTSKLVSNA